MTCRELPDRVLNFMRSHPLMNEEVDHEGGAPVFYKKDVVFTNLVVQKITAGIINAMHKVRHCTLCRLTAREKKHNTLRIFRNKSTFRNTTVQAGAQLGGGAQGVRAPSCISNFV